ncbi:MAG TPA: hypothetical protein DCY93_03855, partial [Firmicutes bacterium]|nr:hypothetical protein [Bacillota bacterium]
IAHAMYHYNSYNCTSKYNPKLYLGTIQNITSRWNFDNDSARGNLAQGDQKSGSWPHFLSKKIILKHS